jgi:hypothetical protein
MNLAQIQTRVRQLTDVYSTDLISDALLKAWVNEAYNEITTSQIWPWVESVVELNGPGDEPVFDDIFHVALAYRVAVRVLAQQGDQTERADAYGQEYVLLLQRMVELYLPAIATGETATLEELRWMVRDLTGKYSFEVSDGMINNLINQSYNEVARARPWPWLEQTIEELLAPGDTTVELPGGARRVMNVFVLENGNLRPILPVVSSPHLLDVEEYARTYRYDVSYDGTLTIAPAPTSPITLRIRYLVRTVRLTNGAGPAFDEQFNPMLAYMAALKVVGIYGPGRSSPDALVSQIQEMLSGMVSEYLIDHSEHPVQMGGVGGFNDRYPTHLRII